VRSLKTGEESEDGKKGKESERVIAIGETQNNDVLCANHCAPAEHVVGIVDRGTCRLGRVVARCFR
jgi:hypothetical protein